MLHFKCHLHSFSKAHAGHIDVVCKWTLAQLKWEKKAAYWKDDMSLLWSPPGRQHCALKESSRIMWWWQACKAPRFLSTKCHKIRRCNQESMPVWRPCINVWTVIGQLTKIWFTNKSSRVLKYLVWPVVNISQYFQYFRALSIYFHLS